MRIRLAFLAIIAIALFGLFSPPKTAHAQQWVVPCTIVTGNATNPNNTGCVPYQASARNFPGCTVGASSAQCLAAGTAKTFVQIQNTSASATIACAWGATAVLNSAGSVQLSPGQPASWGPNTGGIPNQALNCIASAGSTPLYVEWY